MNNQLRLLIILGVLLAANLGWRVWANWGKITIDVTDAPVAEVLRQLEGQGGIRLCASLPADTKVTMHVRNVPLLHALEVLATNTEANWNVAYFTAPDKGTIQNVLGSLSNGQQPEGWKRFGIGMGPMRGRMEESEEGTMDPREEEWKVKPAPEGTLHAYLQQASNVLSVQLWAPEQWNPAITKTPGSGEVETVIPKLAKAARGQSMEVFLLRGRGRAPRAVTSADQDSQESSSRPSPRLSSGNRRGGMGGEEMRRAMEERELARIERLPKDKQSEAYAALEERKKFFEELAALPEAERRAKMEERMEQMMNDPAVSARMSEGSAKRGAMQTADQRTERYRDYLNRKREAN